MNDRPAFPTIDIEPEGSGASASTRGMTLRQWYAGMALQGIIAAQAGEKHQETLVKSAARFNHTVLQHMVVMSFEAADCMIAYNDKK